MIEVMDYSFTAELWEWEGQGAWHFVTLPKAISAEIKEHFGTGRPGFGSVKVRAQIGSTKWETSIFPDAKRGAYLLPIKKAVRVAESCTVGDTVNVSLSIVIS